MNNYNTLDYNRESIAMKLIDLSSSRSVHNKPIYNIYHKQYYYFIFILTLATWEEVEFKSQPEPPTPQTSHTINVDKPLQ